MIQELTPGQHPCPHYPYDPQPEGIPGRRIADPCDPKTQLLLPSLLACHPIRFTYHGGTSPGQTRTILPGLLFHPEDTPTTTYCLGWCQKRQSNRLFRLDRMSQIEPVPHSSLPTYRALADIAREIQTTYPTSGDHITILNPLLTGYIYE